MRRERHDRIEANIAHGPGGSWAFFRLPTTNDHWHPERTTKNDRDTAAALRKIRQPFVLMSLTGPIDRGAAHDTIAAGMAATSQLGSLNEHRREAYIAGELDMLTGATERATYIAIDFTPPSFVDNPLGAARNVVAGQPTARIRRSLARVANGHKAGAPVDHEKVNRIGNRLFQLLPGTRPVTPTEMRWIAAHALVRHTDFEVACTPSEIGSSRSGMGWLNHLTLHESPSSAHRPEGVGPYTEIRNGGDVIGYQTAFVLTDVPFLSDGELYRWVDQLAYENEETGEIVPFPVDVVQFVKPETNRVAVTAVTRKVGQLNFQGGESQNTRAGLPYELERAQAVAEAHKAKLELDRTATNLVTTTILMLGAPTLDELAARSVYLTEHFDANHWLMFQPHGAQARLCLTSFPSHARRAEGLNRFRQDLLPEDLAAYGPLSGSMLGQEAGGVFGFVGDVATIRPVYLALDRLSDEHDLASMMLFGEPGSGKSWALKKAVEIHALRGARIVIIDPSNESDERDGSQTGEWIRFALGLEARYGLTVDIVSVTGEKAERVALNGFQVLRGVDALMVMREYFSILGRVDPDDEAFIDLVDAVVAVADMADVHGNPTGTPIDVVNLLAQRPSEPAQRLARKLRNVAHTTPLAGVVFQAAARQIRRETQITVLHLPDITSESTTADPDHRTLEDNARDALLYLVAGITRDIVLSDKTQFGLAVLDEVHWLAGTRPGLQIIDSIVRGARKGNGGAIMATHTVADFLKHAGPAGETLLNLMKQPVLGMGVKGTAAPDVLVRLGIDPADENFGQLVTWLADLSTAAGLFRDPNGTIGQLRVAPFLDPVLAHAARTDPANRRKKASV